MEKKKKIIINEKKNKKLCNSKHITNCVPLVPCYQIINHY